MMGAGKYGPHTELVEAFLEEVRAADRDVWHRVAELSDIWTKVFQGSRAATTQRFSAAVFSALDSATFRAYRGLKLGSGEFSAEELASLSGVHPNNVMEELNSAIFLLAQWDLVPLENRRTRLAPFAEAGFSSIVSVVADDRPADDVAVAESYRETHPLGWRRYGPNGKAVEAYIDKIPTIDQNVWSSLLDIARSTEDANMSLNTIWMSSLSLAAIRAVKNDISAVAKVLEFDAENDNREFSTKRRILNGGQLLSVAGEREPRWRRAGLMPFAELGMTSVLATMIDETPPIDVEYPQNAELVTGFLRQVSRLPHEAWHRLFDLTAPTDALMVAQDEVDLPLFGEFRRCNVYGETTKALRKARREPCCEDMWPRLTTRVRTASHLLAVQDQVPVEHRHTVLEPFVVVGFTSLTSVLEG